MLPDLITYAPTIVAEFHLSLPQDLITSLFLLRAVKAFEGLSEWVYQTAALLPQDFQAELDLLGYPIKWCFRRQDSLIWRLPPEHPVHRDLDAFFHYLEDTPAQEFQRLLLLNLAHETQGARAGRPSQASNRQRMLSSDPEMWRRTLQQVRELEREKLGQAFVDLVEDEALIALMQHPARLKARTIHLLARFRDQFYDHDLEKRRAAMARSVAFHRQQTYPHNFGDVFRQVTGRALPSTVRDHVQGHLDKIERVIFSPCAHLGLYFQLTLSYPTLAVAFNYRTTPTPAAQDSSAVELFPPLKALADESRLHILSLLQGQERCAQEIVEAVGLSQSTVSRHLQLLERTEVVVSRQEHRTKYYSIDRSKGKVIIAALQRLIG